jgi:acylphosphatase
MVQGVFFRANAQREAARLGLSGIVRNTSDGGVEVVAEGEESTLHELVLWCHKGPPASRVESVKTDWQDATGEFSGFRITY